MLKLQSLPSDRRYLCEGHASILSEFLELFTKVLTRDEFFFLLKNCYGDVPSVVSVCFYLNSQKFPTALGLLGA